ncbi:hypothetical protein BaRGS_00020511 [Batillaria attramentaria]|uniref:Uncharacterized protein n=1 Tax=Batillaria attramentaria TaxID=370345 RepID=A0ABD0KLY1_9CAEN
MWNSYGSFFPFSSYFYSRGERPGNDRQVFKRSTDELSGKERVSNMMGYWPQWWNTYYNHWPGWNYWNNYNWMWNNGGRYFPGYSRTDQDSDPSHSVSKRSTDDEKISNMMGDYGSYWPQWWNNYNFWPRMNYNWMWNNYRRYFPYFSRADHDSDSRQTVVKRSTDKSSAREQPSRMMGGYSGYWPQCGTTTTGMDGNRWNNYNWMWKLWPTVFFRCTPRTTRNQNDQDTLFTNAAQTTTKTHERASRMMVGFGGYWPHVVEQLL